MVIARLLSNLTRGESALGQAETVVILLGVTLIVALTSRGVTSCPDSLTNLDNRVLAALDQSGLPAFLPHSGKLAHQVMSARAHGLERAPSGPTIAPPPYVRASLHAGLACFIGVSLHRHLPSRIYLNRASRTPSGPPPRAGMYKRENLSFHVHVF
jgi:hypothetical protein